VNPPVLDETGLRPARAHRRAPSARTVYGPDVTDTLRRSAAIADRVLRGAKPAEMPVQAPIKYGIVINLKTIKSLGLTVPPAVLARADEAIE